MGGQDSAKNGGSRELQLRVHVGKKSEEFCS